MWQQHQNLTCTAAPRGADTTNQSPICCRRICLCNVLHTSLQVARAWSLLAIVRLLACAEQPFHMLQLIIMLTPIRQFFKVDDQTWYEWLIAIALGVGALLWAFTVKLVSRWACHAAHHLLHQTPATLWQPLKPAIQQTRHPSAQHAALGAHQPPACAAALSQIHA